MRFTSLGSGSRGNATLVEGGGTRIMIDCGFSAKEAEKRLVEVGLKPEELDGILVTHEHQDHIQGVGPLARRYGLPVWITHGTHLKGRLGEVADLRLIHSHQKDFSVGNLQVQPYPVPHDAWEPVQYAFSVEGLKFGVLTDVGEITPHICHVLADCDALMLEFNHDVEMLANGPYPLSLQRRVGGRLGHLNNQQATDLLARLQHGRLKHLVAAHLSEKNNAPSRVRETILSIIPEMEERLTITQQDSSCGWFEI